MAKIEFYKINGEKDIAREYPESLKSEISASRILEYIRYVRNANRDAIANTKNKSEVSGGGKKPWKQKGTGRARHGSRRSPIWIGGGITFGPRSNRNFEIKINKKERKAALLAVIFSKVINKSAIGVEELKFSAPKTKEASGVIEKLPLKGFVGLFLERDNENLEKSFRNIPTVRLFNFDKLDVVSILCADSLLFTKKSLQELEAILSKKSQTIKKIDYNKIEKRELKDE